MHKYLCMIKIYTSRLYFKKFPYKVQLFRSGQLNKLAWKRGWTPAKCAKWLDNKSFDFRSRTKVRWKKRLKQVHVTMTVFLPTRDSYDACIKKYASNVVSITEPYDDSHVDLLKNDSNIVIREHLIYKRYKYVVNFRRTWNRSLGDIDDWIKLNFSNNLYANKTMKWISSGWNPRLYIENIEDLVFVKLTWGERIREIIIIQTLDELHVPAALR
jgi:hypothetical protein